MINQKTEEEYMKYIEEENRFKILENYFHEKGIVGHQVDTFNEYLSDGIQRVVHESSLDMGDYSLTFGEIWIPTPSQDEKLIYPQQCRENDSTYDSPIHVDIVEKIKIEGQDTPEINYHRRVIIGRTPIMLRSDKCNLSKLTTKERIEKGECEKDNGGYFIIRGKERVLVGQIRGVYNQPIVLEQKPGERFSYICESRSMSDETGHSVLIQVKISNDDRSILFSLPNIRELIPVGILFKALGFLDEKKIIDIIGLYDDKTIRYIKYIIKDSFFIKTRKEALDYIGKFAIHVIKGDKIEDYALQIVENELLPHMGISSTIKEKVYYLGNMVNKLLRTYVGLRKEDDRDNYANKRVEMAGVLCCELFRPLFKKFLKSIQVNLEKKKQYPDILSIISRTNIITLGLKHSFCLAAGTLITMSNGLSIPIEKISDLHDTDEKVLGYNGKGLIPAKHEGLIEQGLKDTLKLTFENGKTLVCTPNHKIMVLKEDKLTELIEAEKIPINSRIVYGVEFPEDKIEDDIGNDWFLETEYNNKKQKWTISNTKDRNKTLALMRILGFIICDGHIPNITNNQGTVYLGNMFDVNSFIDDYKLVTGLTKTPKIYDKKTESWGLIYSINLSNELTNIIRSIEGVLIGKKVTQERKIPFFLLEESCPKSVIREFLGGLFGGDGHSPRLDIRKGQRTCIDNVKFSWTTEKGNINSLTKVFESIQKLLLKIGVKDSYINGPYHDSSIDSNKIYLRLNLKSNTDFQNFVGFRYCIHKSYKLNVVSAYLKLEEEIKRQHSFIINTVNKIKEDNKNITIKKALEIARKDLIDKEYILNNYYSLSSERDIRKRRENNRLLELKYLQEKFGVPDAKDFIYDMGALYMFEGEYINNREDFELPYFTLKLVDIRKDKKQIVYDITNVEKCNTFLSSGLVVSNCTGNWGIQKNNYIRTGVSQVLSRMTHGAVISHLRRVVIPIGREGKNAKIRQLHASQINFICPCECFDPNTPILLWSGAVKLAKNICVGDILIDDKGNPTRVRKTISGTAPMYDVNIDKPNFLNHTVTSNHILTLKIRNHKRIRGIKKHIVYWFDRNLMKHKYKQFKEYNKAKEFCDNILDDDIIDISIEDYLKLPDKEKEQLVIFKSENINWDKKEVLIEPYILGAWLGDGNSDGVRFTTEDPEILFEFEKWAKKNNTHVVLKPKIFTEKERKQNKKYTYHSHQISDPKIYRPDISYSIENGTLRKLLVKYNLLHNKHIPVDYLVNDRETRLKVLAGLIDTDGSVRANGHEIRICQGPDNYRIIEDALQLAQSLSFCCHINTEKSQWTHYFDDGTTEKRFSEYKELYITGEYLYEIPTILKRKKLEPFTIKNSLAHCDSFKQSKFKLIKKDLGQFVGWQLDGNGRFLLSDFTTVHNTPEGF